MQAIDFENKESRNGSRCHYDSHKIDETSAFIYCNVRIVVHQALFPRAIQEESQNQANEANRSPSTFDTY